MSQQTREAIHWPAGSDAEYSVLTYLQGAQAIAGRDWTAILTSYGLNGCLLQGSDLPDLVTFMLCNRQPAACDGACVAPPDIMLYEWATLQHYPPYAMDLTPLSNRSAARLPFTARRNLFDHLGSSSSNFDQRQFSIEQYKCGASYPSFFSPRICL